MSLNLFPRLHFRGGFTADVFTANNDDIVSAFPADAFVDSARVRVDTKGMPVPEFRSWMRQVVPDFGIRAGWNLYGDGTVTLDGATITSVATGPGTLLSAEAGDPVIGASVNLIEACMVDLDPEGTLGTQIFCNELQMQGSGGQFLSGTPTRLYSRFVERRNLAARGFSAFSAVWHAVMSPDLFTINAGTSPSLTALQQGQQEELGLYVRFVIYLLAPRLGAAQLAADFAQGLGTKNPARGRVLGTIGLWRPGEMKTITQGRRLFASSQLMSEHGPFTLNQAVVRVDRSERLISADFINTFPELNETLIKVDVGEVALGVRTANGTVKRVGPLNYRRAGYEAQGGISDLTYPAALDTDIANGRLVVLQEATGTVLLAEADRIVETDDRCVYLEEGEEREVSLRLFQKGEAPNQPVAVALQQQVTNIAAPANPNAVVVQAPGQVSTGNDGVARLVLKGVRPGTCLLVLNPVGTTAPSSSFFLNVRVLPEDDYEHVPDAQLTWDFVYEEVFKFYDLLYPDMNRHVDLGNEMHTRLRAPAILERIVPEVWDRTQYMPRSRDLSAGKRRLIERWCKHVMLG